MDLTSQRWPFMRRTGASRAQVRARRRVWWATRVEPCLRGPEGLECRRLLCASLHLPESGSAYVATASDHQDVASSGVMSMSGGEGSSASVASTTGVTGVSHPSVTSFVVNTTGAMGASSDADINAVVSGYEADVQAVWYTADATYVYASGVPSYEVGPWPDGNPAVATDRDWLFQIPQTPQPETGTKTAVSLGNIGIYVNGLPVYDAQDGMSYNNAGVWRQNAIHFEADGFDTALGHPSPVQTGGPGGGGPGGGGPGGGGPGGGGPGGTPPPTPGGGGGGDPGGFVDGAYHHHQNPASLRAQFGDEGAGHSPILGWAFDGYPIYGPYGYATSDGSGEIVRFDSSYQLRSGTRTSGPGGTYDGSYIEDYEYVAGSGHLDEHNGRFGVTAEYPQGTYFYVATIDTAGNAAYPYAIGPTYYGVVETANLTQTVTLPGDATEFQDPRVIVDVVQGTTETGTTSYAGLDVIVKRGLGTLILDQVNTHSGGLVVDAGEVVVRHAAALNGGPVVIQAGATLKLEVGASLVSLASIDLPANAHLDVGEGGFTVASGGFDAESVRNALAAGRNGGAWDGQSGITLTNTSANASLSLAVGFVVAGDGVLEVRMTADGDAQLSGRVDFDDVLAMFPNYGQAGTFAWADGDFTYDGQVDFDDVLAMFPNYGGDAVFGASGLGSGGGEAGLLGGGDGRGSGLVTTMFGDHGSDPLAEPAPMPQSEPTQIVGPLLPADVATSTAVVLQRAPSQEWSTEEATALVFAALAADEDEADEMLAVEVTTDLG
jgi:autotransporter-associated beta strand protein